MLQQAGWQLLSRNWQCRWGELDLVLCKPGRLLLVEVKGRGAGSFDGAGVAALRRSKLLRLERAWACWLADHGEWAEQPVEQVAALVLEGLPALIKETPQAPLTPARLVDGEGRATTTFN